MQAAPAVVPSALREEGDREEAVAVARCAGALAVALLLVCVPLRGLTATPRDVWYLSELTQAG